MRKAIIALTAIIMLFANALMTPAMGQTDGIDYTATAEDLSPALDTIWEDAPSMESIAGDVKEIRRNINQVNYLANATYMAVVNKTQLQANLNSQVIDSILNSGMPKNVVVMTKPALTTSTTTTSASTSGVKNGATATASKSSGKTATTTATGTKSASATTRGAWTRGSKSSASSDLAAAESLKKLDYSKLPAAKTKVGQIGVDPKIREVSMRYSDIKKNKIDVKKAENTLAALGFKFTPTRR